MPPTEDGPRTETAPAEEVDEGKAKATAVAGDSRRAQVLDGLQRNYQQVQYHYVQYLAEHLTDCRKSLGGDFDDLMMLAVLGQRLLGARLAIVAGDPEAENRVWMSALRLSDVTGVPRESVRRKLFRLQVRGWVKNDPQKGWRIAGTMEQAQARDDLADLDSRSLKRLARLVSDLLPFVAPGALGDRPTRDSGHQLDTCTCINGHNPAVRQKLNSKRSVMPAEDRSEE